MTRPLARLLCLTGHRFRAIGLRHVRRLAPGFARLFGDTQLVSRCTRCGRERTAPLYRRRASNGAPSKETTDGLR